MSTVYMDYRGWRFRVMQGLGEHCYKARYQKPGSQGDHGWKAVKTLPWRKTEAEAEADLEEYARKHGMHKGGDQGK